jgi:hypothetical protein
MEQEQQVSILRRYQSCGFISPKVCENAVATGKVAEHIALVGTY